MTSVGGASAVGRAMREAHRPPAPLSVTRPLVAPRRAAWGIPRHCHTWRRSSTKGDVDRRDAVSSREGSEGDGEDASTSQAARGADARRVGAESDGLEARNNEGKGSRDGESRERADRDGAGGTESERGANSAGGRGGGDQVDSEQWGQRPPRVSGAARLMGAMGGVVVRLLSASIQGTAAVGVAWALRADLFQGFDLSNPRHMLTAASLALPILAIDALLLLPNYTASSDAPLRVTVPAVKPRPRLSPDDPTPPRTWRGVVVGVPGGIIVKGTRMSETEQELEMLGSTVQGPLFRRAAYTLQRRLLERRGREVDIASPLLTEVAVTVVAAMGREMFARGAALLFFTAWSLDRLSEAGIEPELARTQAPWLGLACMTAAVVGVGVVGRWSSRGVAEGGVGGIEATGGAEADPETIENVRKAVNAAVMRPVTNAWSLSVGMEAAKVAVETVALGSVMILTGSNLAAPYAAAVARDVLRDAYVRRQKRRTVSKRKELLRKVEKKVQEGMGKLEESERGGGEGGTRGSGVGVDRGSSERVGDGAEREGSEGEEGRGGSGSGDGSNGKG